VERTGFFLSLYDFFLDSQQRSHLIVVPPGVAPSDALITSPIFQGDDGGLAQAMAASTGGGGGADANPYAEYGGVNPDLDPELAMALRLSAEEARAHEESQTRVPP
jgi:26S proteasome regulatory subunit N10